MQCTSADFTDLARKSAISVVTVKVLERMVAIDLATLRSFPNSANSLDL